MDKKTNSQIFIEKANIIHNNKYDYSQVQYVNANTKITIICPIHGSSEQTPSKHLIRTGCKQCGLQQKRTRFQKSLQQFIDQSNITHNSKYDYSQVVYINNRTNIKIICPDHGLFEQTPDSHTSGKGCKQCGIQTTQQKRTNTLQQFIDRAKVVHEDKYDYSQVNYINSGIKVQIICPQHGVFEQTPDNHYKYGCSMCKNKTEAKLYQFIQSIYNKNIKKEQTFDWLIYKSKQRIDLYLQDLNLAIELQGRQHFQNIEYFGNRLEKQLQEDLNKEQLLQKNNVSIIYVDQEDVWFDRNDWEKKVQQSIDIIKNKQSDIWMKIYIGTIYQ